MKNVTHLTARRGTRLLTLLAATLILMITGIHQSYSQTAVISGDGAICSGSSINLIVDFTGTAPFTYVYSDGTSSFGPFVTPNNPTTISVSPTVNTTYTLISMNDLNGPGSVSGSATITVQSAPPTGSVTSSGLVVPATGCNGSTAPVSCNVVPGATGYTWTTSPGTVINGNPSPFTTAVNSATLTLGALPAGSSMYEVCVYGSNACGVTNVKCKKIRGSVSTPGPITGPVVACANGSENYSISAVAGAGVYNWSTTGGIVINSGNGTTGVNVTFPAGFSTGTICVNAALSCGNASGDRCITITSGAGLLGAMSGAFTTCPGQTGIAYSVPNDPNISSYTWTVPSNATIASGQGTSSITVDFASNFTSGQMCVTGTSVCGGTTAPRCKTVSTGAPQRPGNVTGSLTGVCGTTVTYSIALVAGATGYTWSVPAGATILVGQGTANVDVQFNPGFAGGQMCVTADNSCGSSPARCVVLGGVPADPAAVTGQNVICDSGLGLVYATTAVSGANSYLWSVPAGAMITSGQGTTSITVDWGTTSGNVTVRAVNGCGQSGSASLPVVFSTTPSTPGPINGPEFICAPLNGVVYYINKVPGALSYLWYFDGSQGGATFVGSTSDTTVTIDFSVSTNSTYKLRVIAVNGYCGNSPYSGKQLRQDISVPQNSGPLFVCGGDSGVYSVPTPVVGAASYTWTAPAGATIDGNASPFNTTNLSVTVVFPVGFAGGDVCVAAVNPCGNATANRCLTISTLPAKPAKVLGPTKVCATATGVMYYTNPVPGATSYTWTAPANATIASGQGTDTVYVDFSNFVTGDICVVANNSCGTSPQECKTLVLNLPSTPSNIVGSLNGLCGGTFNYSVNNVAGTTYNWTIPAGANITAGAGTNAVTIDFAGVSFPSLPNQYLSLCVNATNVCATSADRCVNIKGVTADPGAITGPASVCANQTGVGYSIAAVAGATTYLWTVPTGAVITAGTGTTSITVDYGTNAGSVTVRAQNGCGNSGTKSLGVAMPCRFVDGSQIGLSVYPNPADEAFTVSFTVENASTVSVTITDLAGKVVQSSEVHTEAGYNAFKMNSANLSKGIYLLQLKNGSGVMGNERLAVQ
ncbi:MAG TPA: T9SS type A sorting domain-containing protein [Bacteroidia bacterium]|nr:T9SS type A sorting domain-containing protein [Bacteroidia bacterium]